MHRNNVCCRDACMVTVERGRREGGRNGQREGGRGESVNRQLYTLYQDTSVLRAPLYINRTFSSVLNALK